jgi:hypothetical protein
MKERIDKLYIIKLKICSVKGNSRECEDYAHAGRKYFQKTYLIKKLSENVQGTVKT